MADRILHYRHPDHPVGDVHPYYESGVYHLIYCYDPGTWRVGQLRSTDLLNWKLVEMSHSPPPVVAKILPNFFVLQVIRDPIGGPYRTFYPYYGGIRTSISDDLLHWRFGDPRLAVPSIPGYDRMADPYPFWNEDEQEYWMLMTLRKSGLSLDRAGAFGYVTSSDLAHWTWRGELYYPGDIAEPEVPSMFKLGDKWYLLGFFNNGAFLGEPSYRLSDSPYGPWMKPKPDKLDGKHFCAGRTSFDGAQRLLLGWIPLSIYPSGRQFWGGHFAFPRELYQLPDGRLGTRLEESVGRRIRGEQWFPGDSVALRPKIGSWDITPDGAAYLGSGGDGIAQIDRRCDRVDAEVEITLQTGCKKAGVILDWSPTEPGIEISIDEYHRRLVVETRGASVYSELSIQASTGQIRLLRVIVEENIVEVFLDQQYSLAARIPKKLQNTSVGLFAEDGHALFRRAKMFHLRSLEEVATLDQNTARATEEFTSAAKGA